MIELLARSNTNVVSEIVPILLFVALIAVCITVWSIFTRSVEPWKRKYFKPSKQLRVDFVRVLIFKVRAHWPTAFVGDPPWDEQHIDLEKVVNAVEHVKQPTPIDLSNIVLDEIKKAGQNAKQ